MDKIDKKIACALDYDCRTPIATLAKKMRVNRNVVAYRIKKLEEQGIIQKYICSIDLGKLGYKTYKIFLRVLIDDQEKDLVAYIKNHKQVIHALKLEGLYNYSCTFVAKNIRELDDFLSELKSRFDVLRDYGVNMVVYSRVFKLEKLLLGEKQNNLKLIKYSGEGKKIIFDEKDKKILHALSQEANIPLVDLAQKTKLSLDIVKYRLKKLKSEIITSFRVQFDVNKLGFFHYVLMIKSRSCTKEDEQRLMTWCSLKPNVLYCTKRIGTYDFEINIAIKDLHELNTFMTDIKKEFGSIIELYETILNNKILKLNYFPF